MNSFNPDKFKLPDNTGDKEKTIITPERQIKRKRQGGKFLKGPIQLDWLIVAAHLPGKAFLVGIVIWFRSGLCKSNTVTLSSITLGIFGVDRHAKRRALEELEDASLITVKKANGKNPIVTILKGRK